MPPMRQSQLFSKTAKSTPEGEETANAKLLIRGGFIAKSSAGVYSFLPLGLRVLDRINTIIREEINVLGAEELLMPALIDKKYWEKSARWDTDVIYRATGKATTKHEGEFEYGLGWTHEEVVATIAERFINSYRDLPKSVYQIQNKFRAEVRPQGGLLRTREFLMKDLYSFHRNNEDLNHFYERAKEAYQKVFARLSLNTLVVEASGGAFTKEYTHEFQVLNGAGEDTVHYCTMCGFAMNKEVFDEKRHKNCKGEIQSGRAIEVGNIFKLGTRFSESFGLRFKDEKGVEYPVVMGSYGIGPTRAMGTIVEVHYDERGIVWPEAVAPFAVHLVYLSAKAESASGGKSQKTSVKSAADALYERLQKSGVQVLFDDREATSAGEKFADADLIGIPYRAVVSERTIPKVEVKRRNEKDTTLITVKELIRSVSRSL